MLRCFICLLFFITTIVSSKAGRGFDQLDHLNRLEDLGVPIPNSEYAEFGNDILEQCKTNSVLLAQVCEIFKGEALKGNNVPALVLGMYMHDFAPAKGEAFLLELAESGDADAMLLLAVQYYESKKEQALKWLRSAADQGDQDAVQLLVLNYEKDLKEEERAKYIFVLAEAKTPIGLVLLANMYGTGEGVDRNEDEAIRLYNEAWDAGVPNAGVMLAMLYKEKDSKLSLDWLKKGAEAGDRLAQFEWGMVLIAGEFTSKNVADGMKWVQMSADAGYHSAQFEMGRRYHLGLVGVEKDPSQALHWFLLAAKQNDAEAQYLVGKIYMKDGQASEAYKWLKKASDNGDAKAKKMLKSIEKGSP